MSSDPGAVAPTPRMRRSIVIATGGVVAAAIVAVLIWLFVIPSTTGPTVVEFRVAEYEDQTYKIELATPELVEHVKQLMAGEDVAKIPIGLIVRDDPGVNAPWSWHIDPASLEFADVTTEVCDGLPEYVEDGTLTSPYFCPWLTEVVSLTGPGAR